jgi:hypothetical protein
MAANDQSLGLEALKQLLNNANSPAWSADASNREGMQMDVEHSLDIAGCFGEVRWFGAGEDMSLETEWRGEGKSLADVQRDVFRAIGDFSEDMLFISRELLPRALVHRIITGGVQGFGAHGHILTIRLIGVRIEEVIVEYERIRRQWEELPRDKDGRPILQLPPTGDSPPQTK